MCFRFCLSWISFIWIMHHNHMECFIFPNELWKCTNVQLYELWKCTNVQLYELWKCTNVQLCIMKFNAMEAKHSQGLIWRADRLNCSQVPQLYCIYMPPWFYTFQSQVQPYQYCVQVWSWREGLLTFTWVVIAITLLRICLPRWSAWHGMVWCVTTRKPY